MRTVTINDTTYSVDDRLDKTHFGIHQKPSSNVEFFGSNPFNYFFIQFKNGTSYIFSGVDNQTLMDVHDSDSIGKFFNTRIKNKFLSEKIEERLVKALPVPDENKELSDYEPEYPLPSDFLGGDRDNDYND